MAFEFDNIESDTNQSKHGIDFIDAQQFWDDPELVIIPARTSDEKRFLSAGRIKNKLWSAVFAIREKNIRIISVRRSSKNDEETYHR